MRRQLFLWSGLAILLLVCERWLTSCLGAGPCLGAAAGPHQWLSLAVAASSFLAAASAIAWVARTLWLAADSSWRTRMLERAQTPRELREVAIRVGVRRLRLLACSTPVAFCAGAIRPAVYLSQGAYERLGQEELEAVLLHELDHALTLEPLRRAAWRAAAEVGFFVPIVRWMGARRLERSELRADRRALCRLGARPVASALWRLDPSPRPGVSAAFDSAIELRAAQLLGDPIPRRLPAPWLISASTMGAVFAVMVVACAAEVLARLAVA